MPNLIENVMRGAVSAIPSLNGDEAYEKSQRLRGESLVKNLTGGGLALGAGVSAGVVLLNYLKSLSAEADLQDDARLDDETLYIPEPVKRASDEGVNKWLAPGLAITGGVLGVGAGYAAVQAVYNRLQRRRLEKMLDQAQNETLTAVDAETRKSASDAKLNLSDILTAFPVATPLLVALASGGVAAAALNKAFPVINKSKSKFPRRVRVVSENGELSTPDEEIDTRKSASAVDVWAERDLEHAGFEFLALLTDSLATEKKASLCLTSDILNKAAKEGVGAMGEAYLSLGLPALIEIVKGASDAPASTPDKILGAMAIFKHATFGTVAAAIAASEYLDMAPAIAGLVENADAELLDKSAGLAPLLHLSLTRPFAVEAVKTANWDLLRELLASVGMSRNKPTATGASHREEEERDAALTSDVNGSMTEDADGHSTVGNDDESQADDDVVDEFMSSPKQVAEKLPQR